ncbi:hypothetical protein V6N12_050848 [Hibiscus sabdariffa]|uniref:Uncharacterized protein n=1 Tax=Hibiscus sabdariffa TaxID=183260 RepID=A0ABR2GDL7_9ROSI
MAGDKDTPPQPLPKIDISSLFFLGPQDRPRDFLISARLNNEDWTAEIETDLQARRKFRFLDDTIIAPIPPCTDVDWTVIHTMLVSWIMNNITIEKVIEIENVIENDIQD